MNREQQILAFGKEIFNQISRERSSPLSKRYWIEKVMEASMQHPAFKINLFRLVDVLPSLKSAEAIATHVEEYLGPVAREIHTGLEWAIARGTIVKSFATALSVKQGVSEVAKLFIAGEGPEDARKALYGIRKSNLAFTIDLLGEFSVSEEEALIYLKRYLDALDVLAEEVPRWNKLPQHVASHRGDSSPLCISVKLSALYSQCNPLNYEKSVAVLKERLSEIARKAARYNAQIYVDAEDSANNPIIYETFMQVFGSAEFKSIPYAGIVVQAYSPAAKHWIDTLLAFAKSRGAPIAVRLVKGAYWDYETVLSKQSGLASPLFAHKCSSDALYESLSRTLIDNHQHCLPAFASHNIRSLSHACIYAHEQGLTPKDFELQMLYGMAEPIAKTFSAKGYLVRLYVPLGDMFVGMGYLVRRLLENTSNESFLRHTFFDEHSIESLLAAPQMHPDDNLGV
jgi:RHH-type proline utilization regulon transcriptional repressor/proline dehydrogenase/delta 1-pyrroline-5-carboxylate dehydrogenase